MLKKTKVKAIHLVELYCDKCGSKMGPTNIAYPTYPVQYEYRCECGNKVMTSVHYPYHEYEYEEDSNGTITLYR